MWCLHEPCNKRERITAITWLKYEVLCAKRQTTTISLAWYVGKVTDGRNLSVCAILIHDGKGYRDLYKSGLGPCKNDPSYRSPASVTIQTGVSNVGKYQKPLQSGRRQGNKNAPNSPDFSLTSPAICKISRFDCSRKSGAICKSVK